MHYARPAACARARLFSKRAKSGPTRAGASITHKVYGRDEKLYPQTLVRIPPRVRSSIMSYPKRSEGVSEHTRLMLDGGCSRTRLTSGVRITHTRIRARGLRVTRSARLKTGARAKKEAG